ncbi:MAG TPA: hypothetical protein VFF73_33200 [Planctomycetota bacterium]|nr:hypothetical protein [Planctomycetota bacterium]
MSSKYSPKNVEKSLRIIKAGLPKVLAGGKTMPFQKANQDLAAIGGVVDAALKPFDDATAAKLARKAAVAAKRQNEPVAEQVVKDVEIAVIAAFGASSPEYETLGFTPRKTAAPLTADEKAARTAKMRETKAARGELGKGAMKNKPPTPPTPPVTGSGK